MSSSERTCSSDAARVAIATRCHQAPRSLMSSSMFRRGGAAALRVSAVPCGAPAARPAVVAFRGLLPVSRTARPIAGSAACLEPVNVTFIEEADGTTHTIQVEPGETLLDAAHDNDIELEGAWRRWRKGK